MPTYPSSVSKFDPFCSTYNHFLKNWSVFLSPATPKSRDGRYCNAPRLCVRLSICLSCLVFFYRKILLSHFMFSSCFMLFYMNFWKIEKCPFSSCMFHFSFSHCSPSHTGYGKWFPQIVDDSGNLYPMYPLFPCSDFWGGGGYIWCEWGRVVNFLEKLFFFISFWIVIGCLNFLWNIFFRKTILSHFMFFLSIFGRVACNQTDY